MEEKNIVSRIDTLEQKIDLILEYVNNQRLKSESISDLGKDLEIVGKDLYDTAVDELDKRNVEIDPGQATDLFITLLRNIENFKVVMNTFEMMIDLTKEIGPIANDAIIDLTNKLAVIEQKGYFDIFKEFIRLADNFVSGLSPEDIRNIADNTGLIIDMLKNVTDPKVLNSLNTAARTFVEMDMDNIPSYSMWRLIREMNGKEMKKALGFGITYIKNIQKQ